MVRSVLLLLALLCFVASTVAIFGIGEKKKQEDDNKISAKDSIALGLDQMKNMDSHEFRESMRLMKEDPAAMKEVEKMMKDPAFIEEVNKIKQNPKYLESLAATKEGYTKEKADVSDAELGMMELAKAAKNPKMLAEAMEMLKDPEMLKEVQQMMKDPQFQAEMKRMSQSESFKQAKDMAAAQMEELKKDPIKLKKAEAQMEAMMKA